jgi:hypothetical protein
MQQQLMIKSSISQTTLSRFTFNIPDIDNLFPGFKTGDFAVLYGPQTVTSIATSLCARAQLPNRLGGLDSNIVFIDCANSSSLSNIEQLHHQQIESETTPRRIHNIRVYTAYRLTTLIMEKLQETV